MATTSTINPIKHDKYTDIEVCYTRKRVYGHTSYFVAVRPVTTITYGDMPGVRCITYESDDPQAYDVVNRVSRASQKAERDALKAAHELLPVAVKKVLDETGSELVNGVQEPTAFKPLKW